MNVFCCNIGVYFEKRTTFLKGVFLYGYTYLMLSSWIKYFSEIYTIGFFSSQQSYCDPMNDEVKMILHNFL